MGKCKQMQCKADACHAAMRKESAAQHIIIQAKDWCMCTKVWFMQNSVPE